MVSMNEQNEQQTLLLEHPEQPAEQPAEQQHSTRQRSSTQRPTATGSTKSSAPVIIFDRVSKKFALNHERKMSVRERLSQMFQREKHQDTEHFWALRDVSFEMRRGEAIGLIGQNGSGKSTTLKLITRILEPTAGKITVNGRISALLELGSGFHADLTGRENIYLNGSLLGQSHADMRRKLDDIIDFSELEDFIDTPVKHYSSGMYMRLAFAIAISVEPDILITDEVLAVGDDAFQRKCLDRIYQFKQQGCTILFVSHALSVVQSLCDRVLWFDHGELKVDGVPLVAIDGYLKLANELYRKQVEEERRRRWEEMQEDGTESDIADDDAEEPAEEEEDLERWGTREVEIVKVDFLNCREEPEDIFETGDKLIVRMHYHAHQRIEQPVFGIGIHHRNGLHISGPNTRFSNYPIAWVEGKGKIDFIIESIPFLEGEYDFSTVVYDFSTTHAFDHHERKYSIRVQATTIKERYGTFYIPCHWDLQALPLEKEL
jgi:lipopolysaccharide transport system ATP-binding protein